MQQQQYAHTQAAHQASAGQPSVHYASRSSAAPPSTDNSATTTAARRKAESGSACDFCKSRKLRCGGERPCKNCTERAIQCQNTNSRGGSTSSDLPSYPPYASTSVKLVDPPSRSVSLASSSYATFGAPAIPTPGASSSNAARSATSTAYPTVYYPYPTPQGPNAGYWQTYNKLPYIASAAQGAPFSGPASSASAQPATGAYGAHRIWAPTGDTRKPLQHAKPKPSQRPTRASHFQLDQEVVDQAKILAQSVPLNQGTLNNGTIPPPSQPVFRTNEHGKLQFFSAVSTSSVLADLASRQGGAALGSSSTPGASTGRSKISDLPSLADLQVPEESATEGLIETFFDVLWPIFPVVDRTTITEINRAFRKHSIGDADAQDVAILLAILACATVVRKSLDGRDSSRSLESPEIPLSSDSARKRRRLNDAHDHASISGEGADGQKLYEQCRRIVMQGHASSIRQTIVYGLLAFFNASVGQAADAWQLCGSAMRIAIDLGLHRSSATFSPSEREERRRVFWSLYSLEVALSANLGRPMSLFDEDIDQEYPQDRKGDVSHASKPTSLDGFVHLLKLHRLTSYIIRLNALSLRPESATPKTPERIQSRQLEAESRLQKWFGEMPGSLKGDFEALSQSERIYKHIITGMYPSVYMLVFLPSLPKEGTPPSDFQIYSLSRVVLASKDLCMMAPAFAGLVPPSVYSFDLIQHLLVSSSLLSLVHRKSSASGKGGEQPLQIIEGCIEALQACGELYVGKQRQVVEEAVTHLRTITGSEALRAMSEAPASTSISEASPAFENAPDAPASGRAPAPTPASKRRAQKGSSRRASPKKTSSTRKSPAKARATMKQSATLPEITNTDTDSSLSSLSSSGGPMEDEQAPVAPAVVPSGMVSAAHGSPDGAMEAEASVDSTLDMVKEAIATAPPSAEVFSTDILAGTVDVSTSTIVVGEEEEGQEQEFVEHEALEYFAAPAPPSRTPSAALQSWHAYTSANEGTSAAAAPEVTYSYYPAHEQHEPIQPYSTINYYPATAAARRQSIAPALSSMTAYAQPGESSGGLQTSYSYTGYPPHGYGPAVTGSSQAAGAGASYAVAGQDVAVEEQELLSLSGGEEGHPDPSTTVPAPGAWSEYDTSGPIANYSAARSASTIRPADMQISSAPHNSTISYPSGPAGYYGSHSSHGPSSAYQAPTRW